MRSRAGSGTTWRVGKRRASVSAARASAGSSNCGTIDERIGDIEIAVAGRQPLALNMELGRGMGSGTTSSGRAVGVGHRLEPGQIVGAAGRNFRLADRLRPRPRPFADRRSGPIRRYARRCRRRRSRRRARAPCGRRDSRPSTARCRSRESCGLRFGLSRHCSVVRKVPRPSVSIAPPSRMISGS